MAEVQSLAGYSYPIDGVLDLTARLSGTRQNFSGDSSIHITNGTAYGEPFQSLSTQAHFAGQQVDLSRLALSQSKGGANVMGTASYNLQSRAFTFDLTGKDFQLARVRQIQSERFELGGVGDFHATGSGTTTLGSRRKCPAFQTSSPSA